MVIKWKNRYYNMKGLSQKVEQYLQKGPCLERLRGIVEFEILGLFGMDVFEVIQNIHAPEGVNNMVSTPLWKGGTCLGEWKDDALPEFGPFDTNENKEGMVFWDLLLTNFSHGFGLTCSRERAVVHQALVMAAKGAGVYTLAPHQALVRARARPSIPTHHGSNSMGQACTQH